MHAGTKRGTRIDLDEQLVLVLLRDGLPGWLDEDVIYGKRFEVLFPVVDPVLILRLGYA